MSARDRPRRPEPERVRPIRNWSTLFKADESGDASAAEPGPVGEGVRLGYRVIEDYLRYGEQMARSLSGGPYGSILGGDLMQDLVERTARTASEWMSLWLSQLSAVAGTGSNGSAAPGGAGNGAGCPIRLCVDSRLPLEVSYELKPVAPEQSLVCHPLHPAQGDAAPLRQIALDSRAGVARLSVEVPDDQPAGVYSGVIVDASSGEVRGTVSVEVAERA